MTSRERVLAAIAHKEPDKTPIDFSGHRSSGIMAIAYANLKKALGISSGDIYIYDMVQQLAIVEKPVLDYFGIDTIEMGRAFLTNEKDWKEWVLPDGTPCKIPNYIRVHKQNNDWLLTDDNDMVLGIQKQGCLYFEQTHFPLAERSFENDDFDDLEEILGHSMWTYVAHPGAHLPLDDQGLAEMTTTVKNFRPTTDRAILGLFGGNMFEIPQFLFRIDNFMMYLGLYPDAIHKFNEKLYAIHLKNLEKWLGAVGPYIDIILFGDDLGGQNAPLISPAMYREFFKPYHKKLWQRAKQLADVKVQLHSCGAIEPLLEDLIDAGLDMVNPVQISAAGMESQHLKEKYGDRLTLWGGGCDTGRVLPSASPDEIKKHVKNQVKILQRNGGFVFQQVHNIMANIKPESIIAMFQAVRG